MDTTAPVSIRVVECVAEREGIDLIELDPPLHTAIDTDALDSLFQKTTPETVGREASVEFEYCGYTVRVEGSETVRVLDSDSQGEADVPSSTDTVSD